MKSPLRWNEQNLVRAACCNSWPRLTRRRGGASARLLGVLGCALIWLASFVAAAEPDNVYELLTKAEEIKTFNYAELTAILDSVESRRDSLSPDEHDYLRYLEAWRSAYEGDSQAAVARLTALMDTAKDTTVRLRAGSTAVNALVHIKRYEEAFSRLAVVLDLLPRVKDGGARQQAQLNAAELYNSVGQYDLSLSYAQQVIDANWAGRGFCKGWRQRLLTDYDSGKLKTVDSQLRDAVEACVKAGEINYANSLRIIAGMAYVRKNKLDDAIALLQQHYAELKASHNRLLIAACDAVLADAYRKKGLPVPAEQFAKNVTAGAAKNEFTEALVTAYNVLYELAKQRGDFKSALEYHEQCAAADKAYLTDLSARHLAYQEVNHENIANKLQVDALNKQNHVLQLERELSGKAVETSRLYITVLLMAVVFIALWAYRTKRSQLHFQNLSRLDGLTGIANRPHFIEQAQRALEVSRRTGEQLCIILCDLDHFKSINDRYGHATGDFVLKRTVAVCKTHLTKYDTFGRFGGEEFGILLPSCGPEDARHRAEQLRAAIAEITAHQGITKATVSASFGIATTGSSGHELGQLLAHADAALYEAKRTGRNRVVLHGLVNEVAALALASAMEEVPPYQIPPPAIEVIRSSQA